MYRLLVIISLSALCLGSAENAVSPKIVGGTTSYNPHVVSIFLKPDIFLCAGVAIGKRAIATSARCTMSMSGSSLYVRSGSSMMDEGGTKSSVLMIHTHCQWKLDSPDYDISVLTLVEGVDEKAQVIPVAKEEVPDGKSVLLSGWGAVKDGGALSKELKTTHVLKIKREDCQHFYKGKYNITDRMICGMSPGKGACSGDFGGPVIWNKQLVGLMSFELNCGKSDSPGVFTNMASPAIKSFLNDIISM